MEESNGTAGSNCAPLLLGGGGGNVAVGGWQHVALEAPSQLPSSLPPSHLPPTDKSGGGYESLPSSPVAPGNISRLSPTNCGDGGQVSAEASKEISTDDSVLTSEVATAAAESHLNQQEEANQLPEQQSPCGHIDWIDDDNESSNDENDDGEPYIIARKLLRRRHIRKEQKKRAQKKKNKNKLSELQGPIVASRSKKRKRMTRSKSTQVQSADRSRSEFPVGGPAAKYHRTSTCATTCGNVAGTGTRDILLSTPPSVRRNFGIFSNNTPNADAGRSRPTNTKQGVTVRNIQESCCIIGLTFIPLRCSGRAAGNNTTNA